MSYNELTASGLQGYNSKSDAEVQAALDSGERYLDAMYGRRYGGILVSTDTAVQPNLWPRVNADGSVLLDANSRELVGIPSVILQAEQVAARLILDGNVLLPSTVATASSASTINRDITEETVKVDDIVTTTKWSASGTTESTGVSNQVLSAIGLPIISEIESIMWPLISGTASTSANPYFLRA